MGDWVSVTGVLVEEYRGGTFLQFGGSMAPGAGFTVESTGNALPAPVVVTPGQIAAPLEGSPGEWAVSDHGAEPYESMWLRVYNVTVTDMDLGKASDNYNLQSATLGDAWASDYMNDDLDDPSFDLYHAYVTLGQEFGYVTGILEQYTRDPNWDYYQLLTTSTGDFYLGFIAVPEPAGALMLLAGAPLVLGRRRVWRRKP